MIRKAKLLIISILSVVVLTGCNSVRTPDETQRALVNSDHPRAQLVLGNKDLLDNVIFRDVIFGQVGNFTRAQFQLENLSDQRMSLEYQINWLDNQGFTVLSNNAWHRFTLGPRQVKTLQSVGKSENAYKIQVTVRYPDDLFIESHKLEKAKK